VVEPGEVVAQTASEDPAVGLRGVASLRALLEAVEELQIRSARELGWSWQQIAELHLSLEAGGAPEVREGRAALAAEAAVTPLQRRAADAAGEDDQARGTASSRGRRAAARP
jgi:hypothetical protein